MAIKIIMLILFIIVTISVGFFCRKKAMTTDGYMLGGRSAGPWLSAFAYGTSYFSAVIFVGYAGQFGWKFGVAALWIGIGNALIGSLLAWIVLGRRTRLITQKLDSSTMPDFFGKRFKSNKLKIVASIIIFVFLIPYTASLYNGLSQLFTVAFNIDFTVCIIVMAVVTAIYVIIGGFMATAINDFIQGMIMIIGITAVIFAILNINGGLQGSMELLLKVPNEEGNTGFFGSILGNEPLSLLMVVIFTSLGTWGLPQMVHKFYAIKDEGQIRKGTIISTIFALIVAGGCYFLGGFGRIFFTPTNGKVNYDSIIPTMVEQLPVFLVAVVVVLVLAASMSTLSSLVLTSSSTLTVDLIKPCCKKMSHKQEMLSLRILTVVFITISAIIAIVQSKGGITFIAQLMGISWGALAGAFLAPFLFGLYWKKTTKASVWTSFITGTGIMIVWLIFNMFAPKTLPTFLQSPINCGVIAMVVGLIVVPLVSIFTKAPDEEYINEMYTCYTHKVLVPASKALGEEE